MATEALRKLQKRAGVAPSPIEEQAPPTPMSTRTARSVLRAARSPSENDADIEVIDARSSDEPVAPVHQVGFFFPSS